MAGAPFDQRRFSVPDRGPDLWFIDVFSGARVLGDVGRAYGLIPPSGAATTPRAAAHAALRILLAGYVGQTIAREPFDIAPGGKPSLGGAFGSGVTFSLAHGETAALVAIACDGPVGVDLETPRSIRIAEHRRAALIAAAGALSPDTPLPDEPGEARLLQAWTRLEAFAKATGEGIGALLERLRRDGPDGAQSMISDGRIRVRDVTVRSATPYYAAVAGPGASLAAATSPDATPLPLDRPWLERWLARDPARNAAGG